MSRQPPTFEQWIADTGRFGGSRREYQRIYGEDEGEHMSRIKEEPIPAYLMAMSLTQLEELDDKFDFARSPEARQEWERLVSVRDAAQRELEAFGQKRRDISRAIVAKYEERSKKVKP